MPIADFSMVFPKDQYGRSVGYIKFYNLIRGFGFISPDRNNLDDPVKREDDVFFHLQEFKLGVQLSPGQVVQFRWIKGPKGIKAMDCVVLDQRFPA